MKREVIGVDLGTRNTVIYSATRREIVFNEPTSLALDRATKQIREIGFLADEIQGKAPYSYQIVYPVRNGLIQDPDRTPAAYTPATVSAATTINVIGSTSMTEVMQKLIAAYNEVQPNVTVEQQYPGSGGGRTGVENDTTGNTIGLASSSSPNDAYVENTLCLDAVAVIVNPENEIENITIAQLFDIYTGAVKKFSELK